MKKRRMFLLSLVVFLLCAHAFLSAQENGEGQDRIAKGIDLFSKGLYDQAVVVFQEVIVDPGLSAYHSDAFFWIAKCQMVLNLLDDAQENLEHFLLNYTDHVYYSEAVYQKGRLLFMQNEFEFSILILTDFIVQYPTSAFLSNAYFWVAESLFFMGQLEKALSVYKYIISKFPNSYKFETAKYRISIIEFKKREDELLKLLKWSHLESLKVVEEYQRREKTYEQAISSYQKKLSQAGISYGDDDAVKDEEIDILKSELDKKNKEISDLNKTIQALQQQVNYLESQAAAKTKDKDIASKKDTGKTKKTNEQRILELKKEAEDLTAVLQKILKEEEKNGL